MESMGPWLLLIIAALIVACVSLYFHARQAESQARGEQSVITDELRDAEAALMSALEKIQRMDNALAAREQALASVLGPHGVDRVPAEPVVTATTDRAPTPVTVPPEPARPVRTEDLEREPRPGSGSITDREGRAEPPHTGWRMRAVELAQAGKTPLQIARDLELPVGEVELALWR